MASAARRKRLLFGVAALLLVADGALLGVWAVRRADGGGTTTEARVSAVFGILRQDGLAASLDALERAAAEDPAVLRDAHQLAHALGREAVVARGGDASVLGACRPVFASGCYHGVVEAYVGVHGRIDMAALERMCAAAGSNEQPGPVYECIHGLGHGVLGAVRLDVDSALRYCDALSRPGAGVWCHAGVFMEAVNAAVGASGAGGGQGPMQHEHGEPGGHRSVDMVLVDRIALDTRNPYSPCDRFGDPYAASCWLFQGFLLLRAHNFDVADALRACDAAPGGRAGACYEGIGLQFAGLFQRGDAWAVAQCATGRTALASRCAAGVARAFDGMDWSGVRAVRFCRASPKAWKDECYRATAAVLAGLASPRQRTALCAQVESEYVEACRSAAALGS
jgi:hypothetical protein